MKIEFIPVDLIDDYENNSNTHPEEQLHQIEALITEFGWTMPALLTKNGERFGLVAGHGRREAAERMYSNGNVLRMADGTAIPANTIPAVFADNWSEAQKAAYVMADNQSARNSIQDRDVIAEEIKKLEELDFDIEIIGFDFDLEDDGLGWDADESKISDDIHLDGIDAQVVIICSQEEKDRIQQLCSKAIIEEGITGFEFKA